MNRFELDKFEALSYIMRTVAGSFRYSNNEIDEIVDCLEDIRIDSQLESNEDEFIVSAIKYYKSCKE